jgi:putative transposase
LTYKNCRHANAGEEGTPMLKVVADETTRTELSASLDEICREGAQRMLAAALEAEADGYVEALTGEVDEDG